MPAAAVAPIHPGKGTNTCMLTNALKTIVTVTVTVTELLQRIVLRGIMQCYRLVGKDGFSALIGTVGDC